MANGFFAGGVAQGIAPLAQNMMGAYNLGLEKEKLGMMQKAEEAKQRKQMMDEYLKMRDTAMQSLTQARNEHIKGGGTIADENFMNTYNILAGQVVTTAAMMQQAGFNTNPEFEKGLFDGLLVAPSLEEIASAEGKTSVKRAETIARESGQQRNEVLQAQKIIPGPESPAGKLKADFARGYLSKADYEVALAKANREADTIASVVVPILNQVKAKGIESLSEEQWDTLALAARQSGLDIAMEKQIRSLLLTKDKSPQGQPQKPEEALPMPKSEAELEKGKVYKTMRGNARWNGSSFELL